MTYEFYSTGAIKVFAASAKFGARNRPACMRSLYSLSGSAIARPRCGNKRRHCASSSEATGAEAGSGACNAASSERAAFIYRNNRRRLRKSSRNSNESLTALNGRSPLDLDSDATGATR
jgi:hypothetical protein